MSLSGKNLVARLKDRMGRMKHMSLAWRSVLVAIPCAWLLTLLLPCAAFAHASLLRSDPIKDAILRSSPRGVRMWFTEDLNPVISMAAVLNAASQRIDHQDARVSSTDSREMDLTLPPDLPPGPYLVLWRTGSFSDGHTLRGSFLFTIANPDGSVPASRGITAPKQDPLGGNYTSVGSGQFDAPTLFLFAMITLVDLGAAFWGGAYLWLTLVLGRAKATLPQEKHAMIHGFLRSFSLPVLLLLLLANVGVLAGQGLGATGGQWTAAFAPDLLMKLATSSRFGNFWLMREGVILVALLIALALLIFRRRSYHLGASALWANLFLALLLFFAMSMSSHAAAVTPNLQSLAVFIDWLHLLGAALWVGGMLFMATTYLQVIKKLTIAERARSLVTVLPLYSPLASIGVVLMAVTGPLSATFHMRSWDQFITTAYGRALAVKIALVCALLLTSALQVFFWRPRLKKEQRKYAYVTSRLQTIPSRRPSVEVKDTSSLHQESSLQTASASRQVEKGITQQVRLREQRVTEQTRRLTRILVWEPVLGVAVILCVGLMNVYAGTLTPLPVSPPSTTAIAKPVNTTTKTADGQFSINLTITPNRFGPNTFVVHVADAQTGQTVTNAGVAAYMAMLDMDMGTDSINLQPDGKGNFTALGDLSMAGRWQARVVVRTLDNQLHPSKVEFSTPA